MILSAVVNWQKFELKSLVHFVPLGLLAPLQKHFFVLNTCKEGTILCLLIHRCPLQLSGVPVGCEYLKLLGHASSFGLGFAATVSHGLNAPNDLVVYLPQEFAVHIGAEHLTTVSSEDCGPWAKKSPLLCHP